PGPPVHDDLCAVTDSEAEVRFDVAAKPGLSNLLSIFSAVTGEPIAALEKRFADGGYGRLKSELADAVVAFLEPLQASYQRFLDDRAGLDRILALGAQAARARADSTLERVYAASGFLPAAWD
ncbi:MAG: tryptophan--tRNA ligase, partial [Salinisphaera sp.]|nr:tryptophan--tRNA ligase [Salinisphaera sp.]